MKLDSEFDETVYLCAFRYALPRHTYMPSLMRDKLDEVWDQLPEHAKDIILREIVEHKEFLERMYSVRQEEWTFSEKYDLSEWLEWRKKKLFEMGITDKSE
jgi:hypothetical protein